jgi:hypothetical protein
MNAIDSFAELGSSYCLLIDQHEEYSTEAFVGRIREILPLLYYQALKLPDVESTDDEFQREISHEEWSQMFARLQRKLGGNDLYWVIYDSMKTDLDKPVAASLSDDLADIWRDLKNGLKQWSDGSPAMRQEIVWNWRFSFHHHWSNHAVDALRTINWIVEWYGVRDGGSE